MTVTVTDVEQTTSANVTQPESDVDQAPDWRQVIRNMALGASAGAVLTGAASNPNPFKVQTTAVAACPAAISGPSAEHKLAHKATFGYSLGLEQEIITKGYNTWLKEQLDYTNITAWTTFESNLATTYPAIAALPGDASFCCANAQTRKDNRQELQKARLIRAYSSPAQLFERMVEFWTDHLNTFALTPTLDRMKVFEDRDVIRANALGKLKDMLLASAKSPAMLVYLDGNSNASGNPNENYARELLELHSLGVDVCYDENTIQELAKALTGWRVDVSTNCSTTNCGVVTFDNTKHDNTAKTLVFLTCNQFSIPVNSGINELGLVIDMLTNPFLLDDFQNANRLAELTVKRIASKLATYFLSCKPPQRIINDMWRAYQTSYQAGGNDIAAMMAILLGKNNIHCGSRLLKRPLHLAASAMRATGSIITDPGDEDSPDTLIGGFLKSAGHIPYFWPAPNGYPPPCDEGYWGANLLARKNLGAAMFNITPPYLINGVNSLPAAQAMLAAASNQVAIDLLDTFVFGGFMPAFDKARILAYMDSTVDILARAEALGLLVGSPGFQWY